MLAQAAPGAYAPPYSLLIAVALSAGSTGMRTWRTIAYFALSLGYLIAAFGYAAYSGTGPCRRMTDWQLALYDLYSRIGNFVILLIPLVALGIPFFALLARLLMTGERKTALARAVLTRVAASNARRPSLCRLIAGGPVIDMALAVALVAGGIAGGYALTARSHQGVSAQEFDIATLGRPGADYVRATGVAHSDIAVKTATSHRRGTTVETYVPLTARKWRRDQPIAYFLKATQKDLGWITTWQESALGTGRRPFARDARRGDEWRGAVPSHQGLL